MLTLWLSMIVIVPFDLKTIDSQKQTEDQIKTKSTYEQLVKRIINLGYENVQNTGKLREYTAILISKLLSRPDVLKQGETETLLKRLAADYLETKEDTQQTFKCLGVLQTFVEVFKIGHRDDFLSLINIVFEPVLQTPIENKYMVASTILRKNKVKLAQRIGCIFLKPRVTSWRYKRGSRTLQHLKAAEEKEQKEEEEEHDEEMLNEDEIDFEQLEFIIQLLLDSLKDPDSAVRWTAAKGLGRITCRLTKDFGDQIVE